MFPHDDLEELLDSLNHEPHRQIYMLAIRWGQLEGDSGNTVLTDFPARWNLTVGRSFCAKFCALRPVRITSCAA